MSKLAIGFSGGKDSTYLLLQHPAAVAISVDTGWLSKRAKKNIKRVIKKLGNEHHWVRSEETFLELYKAKIDLPGNTIPNVCIPCSQLITELIITKANELGCDRVLEGFSPEEAAVAPTSTENPLVNDPNYSALRIRKELAKQGVLSMWASNPIRTNCVCLTRS